MQCNFNALALLFPFRISLLGPRSCLSLGSFLQLCLPLHQWLKIPPPPIHLPACKSSPADPSSLLLLLFPTPRASTSEAASTSKLSRKRIHSSSEDLWPKRRRKNEANIVSGPSEYAWNLVEHIEVGEEEFSYVEHHGFHLKMKLSLNVVNLSDSQQTFELPLPLHLPDEVYPRAKVLLDAVRSLPNLSDEDRYEITACGSAGRSAQPSDSDDESITYPSSPPPFSPAELAVVNYVFEYLRRAYVAATTIGYYNCTGKLFFRCLLDFAIRCLPEDKHGHHLALLNTSTGQVQPGAFFIKWDTKKRSLRNSQESDRITSCYERYGDGVLYNRHTHINEIVAEIKQSSEAPTPTTAEAPSPNPAEAQHNEQMIGLWVPNQQAMLGLEFYTEYVVPKVLLLQNNDLHMFYLNKLVLDRSCDLVKLTKMCITFMFYVQTHKAQQ